MSRETERDLAAMVKVEKRAKETARAERDDLRRQLAEVQTALESLTPGGSEFSGSPAVCLAWIRIRLATAGHVAAERNDLRRQLAHANTWRDSLIADGNAARDEAAELRRQLEGERTTAWAQANLYLDANATLRAAVATYAADLARVSAERDELRRQLTEAQADRSEALKALDMVIAERDAAYRALDTARLALHLRDLEDTGLYDAYGQSLK